MPLAERPLIVASAVAYLLVVVAVGVWALRRTRSPKDFFIAGQGIGVFVVGVATMSAAFSGFVFVGGPGLTYRIGLASLFICLPVSFTAAMLGWSVAKRLRLLSEVREVFTVPDALAARFGGRGVRAASAAAVLVGTAGYLGAQILALGVIIETIFGTRQWLGEWSLAAAMGVGVVVILFYSVAGGMVAGVYTDFLQGLLMLVCAVALFFWALSAGGGLQAIGTSIAASESFGAAFLEPVGLVPVATAFGLFFVFGIGVLGQPHMLHKFFMLKEPLQLRWFPLILGGSQSLCILIWIGVGLAVPALVAQGALAPLEHADEAAPAFLLQFTPELLAGVVFAGILAAIMSTGDSFINIGSAALVRDLPRVFGAEVRNQLLWGRLASVAFAVGAAGMAYAYGDLVALLGTFAFGTLGAALVPALAVGLNWARVTRRAAVASVVTGLGLTLGLEWLARAGVFPGPWLVPGALPGVLALAASLTVLFLVTWLDPAARDQRLDPDVRAVLDT